MSNCLTYSVSPLKSEKKSMALESMNPDPSVNGGILNKDSLKDDGEINRSENDQNMAEPEDLEEGEILDSGDEGQNEVTEEFKKKKKKKKRKRKQTADSADVNPDKSHASSKRPKKGLKYIDHDKCKDDQFDQKEFPSPRKRHHQSGEHHPSPKKPNGANNKWNMEGDNQSYNAQNFNKEFDSMEEEHYQSEEEHYSDELVEPGPKRRKPGHQHSRRKKNNNNASGERRNLKASRKAVPESKLRKLVCKFYLDGKCFKGDDCTYRHDGSPSKKPELCKFYLNGFCRSGDGCLFMHESFPCKFFHTGATCYSNENCRFSHEPLTEETKKMLAKCLDSGKLPGDARDEDEIDEEDMYDDCPFDMKKPSLLGSPPKHLRDPIAQDMMERNQNPVSRVANFYTNNEDEDGDYGDFTPVNSEGQDDSWDGEKHQDDFKNEFTQQKQNGNKSNKEEKSSPSNSQKSKDEVSEREAEVKQGSPDQSIPTHLPKKQRELFLRIQQQQRQAQILQDGENQAETNEEEENWYSDDDDDEEEEGDQPLAAVLKKIQQSEPEPVQQNATKAPAFDIASMISAIKNQSSSQNRSDQSSDDDRSSLNTPNRTVLRDPRLSRDASNEKRSPSVNTSQKLPGKDDYFLVTMEISIPGNYNKYAVASTRDSALKSDPRIQKLINKYGSIEKIIIEEEKKSIPKLADFIPPPKARGEMMAGDKKVLPNYSKGIDPRTGRRPPLLPPPMSEGNQEQLNQRFNFPMNTSPARTQPDFQDNNVCNEWSPMNRDQNMFNQSFNPRMNGPGPIRGNFRNPMQNQGMRGMPSPDATRPMMGSPDMPFQGSMQNNLQINRDPRANVASNRDPRNNQTNRDPRMEAISSRDPRMDAVSSRDPRMDASPSRDPRMDSALRDPRALKMDPRDPRSVAKGDTDMRQMNFQNCKQNVNSAIESRDPRQKGMNQLMSSNNMEQLIIPSLADQNLKSVFKAIDPTASPFC